VSAPEESFWASLPLGREVNVIAHDTNGVAALAKPAGVLSHPNTPSDEPRSLLTARYVLDGEVYEWNDANGATQRLWLLNRLDSATSGVILASANGELATEIRAQFKRKQIRKVYHALVFGAPRQAMEVWRDLLTVEKIAGKVRTAATAGHVPAECRMSVLRAGRRDTGVCLVRLEPRTGRSHQLRVQCAKRHLPIVGDQTYGDFPRNRAFAKLAETKRMFLHSHETQFDYEWKGRRHGFAAKAPTPAEFEKFL
jgi:23S rRNA-/tRNA-specific pseudouridylate synthase